jgi:hypothetical protein
MRMITRFVLCLSTGCLGPSSSSGPDDLVKILIVPADQTLVIDGNTPAEGDYQALGLYGDGHTAPLAGVQFTVADGALGSFDGGHFTSTTDHGGRTSVVAGVGKATGTTGLTLKLRQRWADPGSALPASPEQSFSGPDAPAVAPDLIYPNDGVLVPPNLGQLEFHVRPGPGNQLYALSLANDLTDLEVYFACTHSISGGCVYTPDPQVWHWLAETNRGGPPVSAVVRGTAGSGGGVGASGAIALSFSQDDVAGGLYYWTTSGATAIMRVDFAGAEHTPQKFVGPELAGNQCIGCHALSRDGTRMVAEAGGENDGRQLLIDVAHSSLMVPFGSTPKSMFESWDPSGARYVGVYGDQGATDFGLLLFDGSSAALLGSIPGTGTSGQPADHPDWSPDGSSIVYTQAGLRETSQRMWQGAIRRVRSADGVVWSAPIDVVPRATDRNHYYPAFSPDGSLIVYDESTCPPGQGADRTCDATSDPSATLFVVATPPGTPPIRLDRANAPGRADGGRTQLTNSFPKWSPFVFQRTGELGSHLMWMTFSSSRSYGLRPPPASSQASAEASVGTLIWMVAIDPDRAALGADPSYAAFALPFQDLATSNHIAQWTTQVVPPIQ